MNDTAVTTSSFRDAMATIASSVCIVTTSGPSGRYGITVSSLCSVTDAPPTLLVCVNKKGISNQIFKANKKVCVNVLSNTQESIGNHYARGQDYQQTFDDVIWNFPDNSPPELKDATTIIQGMISSVVECGTHSVFFIQVDNLACATQPTGLVYFQRNYVHLG